MSWYHCIAHQLDKQQYQYGARQTDVNFDDRYTCHQKRVRNDQIPHFDPKNGQTFRKFWKISLIKFELNLANFEVSWGTPRVWRFFGHFLTKFLVQILRIWPIFGKNDHFWVVLTPFWGSNDPYNLYLGDEILGQKWRKYTPFSTFFPLFCS